MRNSENRRRQVEKRRAIEKFFVPTNLIAGSRKGLSSPSGAYALTVDRYSTGPHSWEYSRGIVTRTCNGEVVADVKRNYGHFWHSWVCHPNGKEYLLCGEDYQGYAVIDLAKAEMHAYLPNSADEGVAFCWATVYPSNDGTVLAIEGCVWGGPYDLVFYDFSDPSKLPLPEIGSVREIGNVIGWESDNIFAVERERTVRKSDGRSFESLANSEQEELYRNQSAFACMTEIVRWNRATRSLIH